MDACAVNITLFPTNNNEKQNVTALTTMVKSHLSVRAS